MKNTDFLPSDFHELSVDEKFNCTGGGFAYDAGRFLRFMFISGPSGMHAGAAMLDYAVHCQ